MRVQSPGDYSRAAKFQVPCYINFHMVSTISTASYMCYQEWECRTKRFSSGVLV